MNFGFSINFSLLIDFRGGKLVVDWGRWSPVFIIIIINWEKTGKISFSSDNGKIVKMIVTLYFLIN